MLDSCFLYPILLTTDLHLTDNPLDAYRFELFGVIRKLVKQSGVKSLVIGGDLTDAKDEHPARLVNRVVEEFTSLDIPVIINKGNHDYEQAEHPYFRFLNEIPGLVFVDSPMVFDTGDGEWVVCPYSKARPIPGQELVTRDTTHCLFHQTFDGARASNGQEMESKLIASGLPHADTCTYLSGDIHVPQRLGQIEYVGSPYHVHFGDRFSPRMMLWNSPTEVENIKWKGLHRFTAPIASVKDLDALDIRQGDQLKVRLQLARSELADWQEHKSSVQAWCDRHGVKLCAVELITPKARKQLAHDTINTPRSASFETVLERYADFKHLPDADFELGLELGRED